MAKLKVLEEILVNLDIPLLDIQKCEEVIFYLDELLEQETRNKSILEWRKIRREVYSHLTNLVRAEE